jgi:integrase
LLDHFGGEVCPSRVRGNQMASRTASDYLRDCNVLKAGLGKIPLAALEAKHVAKFRDARAEAAPSHVRNEMACLSAALSYAVEAGYVARNVAMDVRRPRKVVRERLITDDEYVAVRTVAGDSVKLAMVLGIRTLGLPADVLRLGPRNIVRYDDGRRTLRFRRGKTNVQVEIEIVGDLEAALEPYLQRPTLHPTFVRREDGKPYTVDGIGAMFRRYCGKAGVSDFGLRDLRAKGATDMFRADSNSIRRIQLLLGHKSVQTTEIYLKGLLTEIVRPNERPIIALVR